LNMILIGIIGPIYSGKKTIANFLKEKLKFEVLSINEYENKPKKLIQYVIKDLKKNYVIYGIDNDTLSALKEFRRRPFFLLLAVDAELNVRYQRRKYSGETSDEFNDFMKKNDENWGKIYEIMYMADFTIMNSSSKDDLYKCLKGLKLKSKDILRPDYDTYFMYLAELVASRTNCIKRKVGCVLVKDSRVIATGYNGTARGLKNCNDGNCKECSQGESGGKSSTCLCLHAEENALLEVGRENKGCILYCNT
ncbi:41409_t:CDS:2, partial [Gigaspora margarita]